MWLFARRVAGPARRLTATILALAAGDRSIEVPLRGRADELGQIARAIETLRCNALLAESIGVRLLEMQHMRAEDKARLLSETTQTNQRLTALNLELKSLAATDALTGVANRRGFDLVLAREWSRAARDQLPLALLLLDVDYFKTFNDRYGHPAGDDCLAWVAAAIGGAARRPGDVVARYGGEEFAVVLPATTLESAGVVAENIRLAVAALAIPHPDNPCGCVTVSLGMSGIFPGESASAEMLVSQADAGLYRAKSGGRNRIGTSGDVAYQTAG
jgi:diguanylate cyclase (GGDEF)-like protein